MKGGDRTSEGAALLLLHACCFALRAPFRHSIVLLETDACGVLGLRGLTPPESGMRRDGGCLQSKTEEPLDLARRCTK